jgi:hypothetical protein
MLSLFSVEAFFAPTCIVFCKPSPKHHLSNTRPNTHTYIYSPPPGAQSAYERWSLVFFTRPGNSKVLRALIEDSTTIAKSVTSKPEKNFETETTAKDWFARRIKYQILANRKVIIINAMNKF